MAPKDQSMAAMRDTIFAIFAFPSVVVGCPDDVDAVCELIG
jgi:hypothetical protein